jgi:biopolymer transport protein ExbD
MRLRLRRQQEPNIDLTPLIDCVFLLLIFFMVSTTFRKETELKLDLPEAAQPPLAAEDAGRMEIGIDAAGRYFINGRALADDRRETLKAALLQSASDQRDRPLVISADAQTAHQAVVTAMEVAAEAGFKQLAITVEHTPSPAAGQE